MAVRVRVVLDLDVVADAALDSLDACHSLSNVQRLAVKDAHLAEAFLRSGIANHCNELIGLDVSDEQ